ncbi:thioredoxin family protein [Bacteroidota bacterium]
MKKIIPKIGIAFVLVFIFLLVTQKDRMMKYVSGSRIKNNEMIVDSSFMFLHNKDSFHGTFIEFGANNCINCKRMKSVFAEIETKYAGELFIKNYIITEEEGLAQAKKFGVISIPMQILLNKKGEIVYKHFGYISANDLSEQIDSRILSANQNLNN